MQKLTCSIADATVALGVSRATIYNWMGDGKLETVKVGGRRLIPISSLDKLIRPERY